MITAPVSQLIPPPPSPLPPCIPAIYHQRSRSAPTSQSASCILYNTRPLLLPRPIYHKTACSTSSPFRLVMLGVGVEVRRRAAVGEKVQRSRTSSCCTRHVMLLPRSGRLPAAGVPPVPHCPLKKCSHPSVFWSRGADCLCCFYLLSSLVFFSLRTNVYEQV